MSLGELVSVDARKRGEAAEGRRKNGGKAREMQRRKHRDYMSRERG